jgi:hypothetical protein
MRQPLAVLALAFALAPACSSKDNTKIVVAVWSDLAVPAELDSVRIDITGPTSTTTQTYALAAGSKTTLPIELELVPLDAKDATFTVKATGLFGQSEMVAQTARVSFVAGQSLLLKLFLARACEGLLSCPADYTCAAGDCTQPIAVTNLPPYNPDETLSAPDGSVGIDSASAEPDSSESFDSESGEAGMYDLRVDDGVKIDSGKGHGPDVPSAMDGADEVGIIFTLDASEDLNSSEDPWDQGGDVLDASTEIDLSMAFDALEKMDTNGPSDGGRKTRDLSGSF